MISVHLEAQMMPVPNIDSSIDVDSLSVGDLVISEIMHDPTFVPDYRGEWFDLQQFGSDANPKRSAGYRKRL